MHMRYLIKKNYLQMIENSLGTLMFRNLFVEDDKGGEKDILNDGRLSCAVFVSSILLLIGEIDRVHGTIDGTVAAMKTAGWKEVAGGKAHAAQIQAAALKPGDVIVWNKIKDFDGKSHGHIGFYFGKKVAISNSTENGFPIKHDYTYFGTRGIEKVLRGKWAAGKGL